ncbi:hypothetical protein F5Y17DRAFT_445888 [Xylariaceae sp. FL0594]|nr:hypothetical protein F5Y17DRAFT_445888 [Xylariaceae sp. FL0594]
MMDSSVKVYTRAGAGSAQPTTTSSHHCNENSNDRNRDKVNNEGQKHQQQHLTLTITHARAPLLLRSLPSGSYLVHATNCLGEWGAGFALELRRVFPSAYAVYREHCESFKPSLTARYPSRDLAGTCLVIPPQEGDGGKGKKSESESQNVPHISIVCLFTSYGYGAPGRRGGKKPGRDGVETILEQTSSALRQMRRMLEPEDEGVDKGADGARNGKAERREDEGRGRGRSSDAGDEEIVIYSPMFNSGAFKVPWEKTEALIQDVFGDWNGKWVVLAPP